MPLTWTLPDAYTDFVFTLEPGIVAVGLVLVVLIGLGLFLFHWIKNC